MLPAASSSRPVGWPAEDRRLPELRSARPSSSSLRGDSTSRIDRLVGDHDGSSSSSTSRYSSQHHPSSVAAYSSHDSANWKSHSHDQMYRGRDGYSSPPYSHGNGASERSRHRSPSPDHRRASRDGGSRSYLSSRHHESDYRRAESSGRGSGKQSSRTWDQRQEDDRSSRSRHADSLYRRGGSSRSRSRESQRRESDRFERSRDRSSRPSPERPRRYNPVRSRGRPTEASGSRSDEDGELAQSNGRGRFSKSDRERIAHDSSCPYPRNRQPDRVRDRVEPIAVPQTAELRRASRATDRTRAGSPGRERGDVALHGVPPTVPPRSAGEPASAAHLDPKASSELFSPLDRSSPSHGSASTPRLEMPSPATTVDSKATNSIEEGKPAQEERAPVARSEMRQSIPDHAASGPETLDPARTPTQSSSDAAGVKKSALSTAPSGWKRIGTVSEDASGSRSQLDPPRSGHGDASRASRVSASIPTEPKAFRGETEAASLTLPSPLDAVTPDLYRQSPAATATAEQKGAVAVVTREPKPISSKEQEALAPSRSTPESQAQKRSFGHVPLPTEMPTEIRAKDYYVEYDPALSKSKSRGKDIIRRSRSLKGDATPVVDPRLQQAKERGRRGDRRRKEHAGHFVRTKFDFDKHSVGDRPPPPPRQLLITGISPRTNSAQVLNLLRSFGSIEEHKLGLNTITGQSLGIFSVTFADDYDEDGKPLELASSRLTLQNGNEVAKKALAAMQGWKMGADTFAVRLDRGRKRFDEACRRSIAHFVDAQKRAAASTGTVEKAASGNIGSRASSTSAGPSTGSHGNGTQVEASPTASMLPPSAPRAHRAPPSRPTAASASAFRSSPLDRASRESEASVSPHRFRSLRMSPAHRSRHDELDSRRHFGTHSVSDHSAGSHRTTSSTNPYGTGASGPVRALPAHGDEYADGNPATEPTEAILRRLHKLGHAYVYISRSNARDVGLSALRSHFEAMHFTPDFVSADDDGFYVAFDVSNAASRAHKVLNGSTVGGYRISIEVRDAPRASDCDRSREAGSGRSGPSSAAELFQRKRALMGQATPEAIDPIRSEYTPDELAEMTFKLIQSELVEKLGLKVKSTLVTTLVTDFMKEGGVGGQIMKQALVGSGDRTAAEVKGDASTSDVALPHFRKVPGTISRDVLDMKIPKKASAVVSETASRKTAPSPASTTKPKQTGGKRTRAVPNGPENGWWSTDEDEPNSKPESSKATRSGPTGSTDRKRLSGFSDDEDQDRSAVASRSVSASVEPSELGHTVPDAKTKTKSARKPSKKRLKAEVILGDEGISTAPNEALEDAASEKSSFAAPPKRASAKKSKPAKAIRAGSPVGDPFVAGVAEDEDDLYYVKLAIERGRDGLPTVEEDWPDPELESAEAEDPLTGDAASTSRQAGHATGSARTEEVYRIPAADKAAHLPDRNKQNKEDSHNVLALASARNNRADSRRLVLGIEQHKKETATDTDILKINQLRTRKKQLKFSKSPIHDWGLYAMEKILPGDMVIEYVGEVVRQQVADEREKQYERQGNFSTYLFRVDDDLVVDATHKGNIARLMNHCCTPNCNAKILTLNGEKRIVLFARTVINPGDELTYDYKFQASADDEDAIACLCGSPGCRRFL